MRRASGSKPVVVELFAGAGLFSYAFTRQGFQIDHAIEIDPVAASTYSKNLGDHISIEDVRDANPKGRCDVLLAGPPCQGFSTLGKRDPLDSRNYLSLEVIRFARALRPKIVVVENVAAFINSSVWRTLSDRLWKSGYKVKAFVLDAYDFGVPQIRLRSFTIATRARMPEIKRIRRPKARSVQQAWEGLPVVPNGLNNHFAPCPSALALARMRLIPDGGDKRDVMRLAPHLSPPSWYSLKCQVTDAWGRMEWNHPSNTLRTTLLNPSKGRYIHPDQHRVISLREAARLHSVPDEWEFLGLPTQIARQIGNSVPPMLGEAVAKGVYDAL